MRLPPERPKMWHVWRRGYLIFYLSYDLVTWYTYRLCCPVCKDLAAIYNCKANNFYILCIFLLTKFLDDRLLQTPTYWECIFITLSTSYK